MNEFYTDSKYILSVIKKTNYDNRKNILDLIELKDIIDNNKKELYSLSIIFRYQIKNPKALLKLAEEAYLTEHKNYIFKINKKINSIKCIQINLLESTKTADSYLKDMKLLCDLVKKSSKGDYPSGMGSNIKAHLLYTKYPLEYCWLLKNYKHPNAEVIIDKIKISLKESKGIEKKKLEEHKLRKKQEENVYKNWLKIGGQP
jgi:hypothetical protein